MECEPPQYVEVEDIVNFVRIYGLRLCDGAVSFLTKYEHLADRLNDKPVSEPAIEQACAQVESSLEHLLNYYDDVRRVQHDHEDAEGYSILRDAYRDSLLRLQASFDDTLEFLGDPDGYEVKHGLLENNTFELNFDDLLSAPPTQLRALRHWLSDRDGETKPPGWILFVVCLAFSALSAWLMTEGGPWTILFVIGATIYGAVRLIGVIFRVR